MSNSSQNYILHLPIIPAAASCHSCPQCRSGINLSGNPRWRSRFLIPIELGMTEADFEMTALYLFPEIQRNTPFEFTGKPP
jgi:hypothetical protein